ncbi:MAG: DUF2157 domain-containing protein [Tepidiformaceae bacterium]
MPSLDDQLERWQQAGILDSATAARIQSFERGRTSVPVEDRPSIAEALVYLGVAVVAVGIIVMAAANWDSFESGARVAITALPAALALAAGFALRSTERPELERASTIAWLLAVALATAAAAVFAAEADWESEDALLLAAAVATAMSLALWTIQPTQPQLAGIAGSLTLVAIAIAARANNDQLPIWGVTEALFGLSALVLVEVGVLTPRLAGRPLFGLMLALGAYMAGAGDSPPELLQALGVIAGALLIALSIYRGVFVYMVLGVGAVFFGLITLILRHIDDPTTAAFALMLMGGALVAGVLILARVRPWRAVHRSQA